MGHSFLESPYTTEYIQHNHYDMIVQIHKYIYPLLFVVAMVTEFTKLFNPVLVNIITCKGKEPFYC